MSLYAVCFVFNTGKGDVGLIVMDSPESATSVRITTASDLCSLAK